MDDLKQIIDVLASCVLTQIEDMENANDKELMDATDMIKDISMAIYYLESVDKMPKNVI